MSTCLALFRQAAVTDLRMDGDKRGTIPVRLRSLDCLPDCINIIAVFHFKCLKSEGLHPQLYIFCKGQIRGSLNRNAIGIIQDDQFGQLERSR